MAASGEYRAGRLALWPMILASKRRYADSHPCAKATHFEAYEIDCGASRMLKRAIPSVRFGHAGPGTSNGGAAQHAVTLSGASAGRYARR